MENKYYIPSSKEELHFGMEVEFLNIHPHPPSEPYWFESMIYPYFYEDYEQQIVASMPNERIRVKYLDQSDIESFGFEFTGKSIDIWFHKEGRWDIGGGHRVTKYILHYGLHDNRLTIKGKTNSGDTDTFFEGYIKNKSELQKLLKQLNIIE